MHASNWLNLAQCSLPFIRSIETVEIEISKLSDFEQCLPDITATLSVVSAKILELHHIHIQEICLDLSWNPQTRIWISSLSLYTVFKIRYFVVIRNSNTIIVSTADDVHYMAYI